MSRSSCAGGGNRGVATGGGGAAKRGESEEVCELAAVEDERAECARSGGRGSGCRWGRGGGRASEAQGCAAAREGEKKGRVETHLSVLAPRAFPLVLDEALEGRCRGSEALSLGEGRSRVGPRVKCLRQDRRRRHVSRVLCVLLVARECEDEARKTRERGPPGGAAVTQRHPAQRVRPQLASEDPHGRLVTVSECIVKQPTDLARSQRRGAGW